MALAPSTAAFLVSLLLFTTLLSSAEDACPYASSVVESLCEAKVGEDGRTYVGKACCLLLAPLSNPVASACLCKGNPDANLQNLYSILEYSCGRLVPKLYVQCGPFETFKVGKIRSVTN